MRKIKEERKIWSWPCGTLEDVRDLANRDGLRVRILDGDLGVIINSFTRHAFEIDVVYGGFRRRNIRQLLRKETFGFIQQAWNHRRLFFHHLFIRWCHFFFLQSFDILLSNDLVSLFLYLFVYGASSVGYIYLYLFPLLRMINTLIAGAWHFWSFLLTLL